MLEALGAGAERDRPVLETLADAIRYQRLLLLLDNCERVVDGVATAIGTLLRAVPGLAVLATSRQAAGGERGAPLRGAHPSPPPAGERGAAGAGAGANGPGARTGRPGNVRRRTPVRGAGPGAAGRTPPSPRTPTPPPSSPSAGAWTGCPWPSSWPPPGYAALRGADRRRAWATGFRLLTGGAPHRPPAPQTLRATWPGATTSAPAGAGASSPAWRCSPGAARRTGAAVCADPGPASADGVLPATAVLDVVSPRWSTQRWCGRTRRTAGARYASGCWRRCGSTPPERLEGAGEAQPLRQARCPLLALATAAASPAQPGREARRGARRGPGPAHVAGPPGDGARQPARPLGWWEGPSPETGEAARGGLRLGGALWRFWYAHAYWREGREWLRRVLDLSGGDLSPALAGMRGHALTAAGALAWAQGEYGAARALHESALEALQALGDRRGRPGPSSDWVRCPA